MPEITDIAIEQDSHVQQLVSAVKNAMGGDNRPVFVTGAIYVNLIGNGHKKPEIIGIAKMANGSNSGRLSIPKNVRDAVGMVDDSEWSIMLNGKDVILRRRSVL